MDLSTAKKFLAACEAAGIKKYQFDTDLGTHYYNDDNSFVLLDEGEEAVVNVRKRTVTHADPYPNDVRVFVSNLADIHEARVGGSFLDIKKFIDAYGLSLNDDQLKILLSIDRANYSIMPMSEDYPGFCYKTEAQIANMTQEEKDQYEADLKAYEEAFVKRGLTQGRAAQITY